MPIISRPGGPGSGTPSLTVQDLLDLDFLRVDANGFIIDGAGANISGSPSVADYPALLALDPATYARYVLNIASGMNNAYFASNSNAFGPVNGQYAHAHVTVHSTLMTATNNVTVTGIADSGVARTPPGTGNRARLTFSGVHGLTTTPAVGASIYNSATVTGFTPGPYRVENISDTTHLDLDVTYAPGMGTPVFKYAGTVIANSDVPLLVVASPALRLNSMLVMEYNVDYSADTNAKKLHFTMDSTQLLEHNTTAANLRVPYRHGWRNLGSTALNESLTSDNGTGYLGATGPVVVPNLQTNAGNTITISTMMAVANVTAKVAGYDMIIRA